MRFLDSRSVKFLVQKTVHGAEVVEVDIPTSDWVAAITTFSGVKIDQKSADIACDVPALVAVNRRLRERARPVVAPSSASEEIDAS